MTGTEVARGPSPWLLRHVHLVPAQGTALDLACGKGRHARYLLTRGMIVTAVDIDLSGLDGLESDGRLEQIVADLEDGRPWPLPGRRFDLVLVANYLHRPLFPRLQQSLNPGGVLIYETFAQGNERYGRPRNPDHLLHPGELIDTFGGALQIVAYEHGYEATPRPAVRQRIVCVNDHQPRPLTP